MLSIWILNRPGKQIHQGLHQVNSAAMNRFCVFGAAGSFRERIGVALPHLTPHSFDPPSSGMLAPVIQRAASEARNTTTSATSSGLPILFNAWIPRAICFPVSVLAKWDMSVSMTPGATALTRIPWGPTSAAQVLDESFNRSFGWGIGDRRWFLQVGRSNHRARPY